MNFESLKTGFRQFLVDNAKPWEKLKLEEKDNKDISIFSYSNEFKNYLNSEFDCDDSILCKDINDILNMQFVDGKLVNPDEALEGDPSLKTEIQNGQSLKEQQELSNENDEGSEAVENTGEEFLETSDDYVNGAENSDFITSLLNDLLVDDEFKTALDTTKDGEVDEDELKEFFETIKGLDGDDKTLSLDDILAAVDNIKNTGSVNAESEIKEDDKIEENKPSDDSTKTSAPSSYTSSGGVSGGYSAGNAGGLGSVNTKPAEKTMSVDEVKTKIQDEQQKIGDIEKEAEGKIQEQEKNKEEAMKEAGLCEKQIEEYKEKEKELDDAIKANDSQIKEKDELIRDKQTTIESNKNYISSLDGQILTCEQRLDSLDEEKDASIVSEIKAKIENLKNEKTRVEKENSDAQKAIDDANSAKSELENKNSELESQKQELLEKTFDTANGKGDDKTVSEAKQKAKDAESEISKIEQDKKSKISQVNNNIKDLEVQLKDAQEAEQRQSFLDENKAGLGLSGEELVEFAQQMLNKYGESHNYCATGVSRTFAMAYGLELSGNGCDWVNNMNNLASQGVFKDVTGDYASSADLVNLPAGAVVCWDATGNGTPGGTYGHVTIADGRGGEISDHHAQTIYQSIGGSSTTYHVYLPI